MNMTNTLIETLRIIAIYNEQLLSKVDGDQGAAKGLITFVDEQTNMTVWNPFCDTSLRFDVIPTETYELHLLQSMVEQLSPKVVMNTAGQCLVDLYQVKIASEVQSIGVSDDCIVGYAESDPFSEEYPTEVWILPFSKGAFE